MFTAVNVKGQVIDETPIIADFGDILPFLYEEGHHSFVRQQLALAQPYLWRGLYSQNGAVRTFDNHDFLLGLLDLYQLSGDSAFLKGCEQALQTLWRDMRRCDQLIDKRVVNAPYAWLNRANPYNGGFVEVLVDLYAITGQDSYLAQAVGEAAKWINGRFFQRHHLFRRINFVESELLSTVAARLASGPLVRLFKDNTNLMFGLVALYTQAPNDELKSAILNWVAGFERYFLSDGAVYLHLDNHFQGVDRDIKAAFSALDLLCDIYWFVEPAADILRSARRISDYWLGQQWSSGLFPQQPNGSYDHLDCNTDMSIALCKLSQLTAESSYLEAAYRCCQANLTHHYTDRGFVLSVDREGRIYDERIITKYQGLLLKLALIDWNNLEIYGNERVYNLLKDR